MRFALCAAAVLSLSSLLGYQQASPPSYETATAARGAATVIRIPRSIQIEHDAIHAALVEATKAPGRVRQAAIDLAAVLHPHLVREEQIALPPLGLLAGLAAGTPITVNTAADALKLTDSLRREMPRMLEEHKRIRTAVQVLRDAAKIDGATNYEALAHRLAHHAQMEEELLYPAALLTADLVRARMPQH
jgi:hypothetical protein